MADFSIELNEPRESVEELEAKIGAKRNGIRRMPDFIEPQELYKELIGSIKKYHPSTDITQVEKAYQIAAAAHKECSGGREELDLQYKTVKTVSDPFGDHKLLVVQLLEHQRQHHYAEVSSRQCLSGPHKDDIEVLLDGLSARSFASQGQTRTAALSLKLAAREIHREIIGEYPVLLLDDVLSELDPKRQEYVLNRIGDGQVFITCCEEDRLHALLQGSVYRVKNGIVTQ